MKKIFWLVVVLLFLTSCTNQSVHHDVENNITTDDDNLIQEEAQNYEEFRTTTWSIEYNDTKFFVQNQTDNSAAFALIEEVYQNRNDASVYLSISFQNGMSADESSDIAATTESEAGADTKVDVSLINGMEIPHVHIAWGESDSSTLYDVYYFDDAAGCYALTLCYYTAATDTWMKEMMDMVNSFSIVSVKHGTG